MGKLNEIKSVQAKTGLFRLAVDNEYGKRLGILEFNPGDPHLVTRIQSGYKKLRDIIAETEQELRKIGYDEDSKDILANEAYFKYISDSDAKLKKVLDDMFDTPFSAIFGNVHVMTPTSEGYLIMNILDAVLPEVETAVKQMNANSKEHYADFKGRH